MINMLISDLEVAASGRSIKMWQACVSAPAVPSNKVNPGCINPGFLVTGGHPKRLAAVV